jgi:quercetin dioxygenase-like cupin family protein
MRATFVRPFKPVELTTATVEAFDLHAMARQLMEEEPFEEHGRNAVTLIRGERLTMVLTVAKEGKVIQEHHAPGPTTVVVLLGSIILSTDGNGEKIPVGNGSAVAFSSDVSHTVEAEKDSAFLIIIGGKGA